MINGEKMVVRLSPIRSGMRLANKRAPNLERKAEFPNIQGCRELQTLQGSNWFSRL